MARFKGKGFHILLELSLLTPWRPPGSRGPPVPPAADEDASSSV
jgi:hypothetical protein